MTVNQKITTFLMFSGQAEEAMNLYISIFEDGEVTNILHQQDGTVLHATFTLKGQQFMCIDSSVKHDFDFTPSISLYVDCESEEEIDRLFEKLSDEGMVLMPLGESPFSAKFGWLQDKFGVSWQLNFPKS
ncbi:VOC family protein [Fictibacillus barbaricus]|uniref:3-demethylubiquinone-9 3-methyltransferase (Glyoxalase superfamily) n=1 Tax=Fictibacillus barbaricus TaxID=182136 RepID=A0ABU1TWI4_9BACL|nr:VOC family protein [Fictibacillus barbaricus]MDR7071584.1 putative 3-demethylubiquinone-9 3-methyltransferase (glyoxalase superfamily) [Fictibacillus barbaricus]